MHFARATAEDWIAHVALNAYSVGIILHVAIGRRWPFLRDPATTSLDT